MSLLLFLFCGMAAAGNKADLSMTDIGEEITAFDGLIDDVEMPSGVDNTQLL
jgi:hypothetical protein